MAKRLLHDGAAEPSLHEHLLKEALGRLAAPEVTERILRLALHEAGLGAVPDESAAFASFACGELRSVVDEALGEDCAAAVVVDLEPAFEIAAEKPDSGVRRRGRRSLPAPAARAPVLVIATEVRSIADTIAGRLHHRAKLVFADDIFGLLQSAQRYGGSSVVLLIHDELSAVRPTTLATLARLLPETATVVQFGRNETLAPEIDGADGMPTWLALGPVTDPDAIADVCLSVLPVALRPRVLLAHPNERYRKQRAEALRDAGYDVTEAPDGTSALQMCQADPPDAVLAPVSLHGIGGLQLAAILAGRSDASPLFVLLSSEAPLDPYDGVATIVSEDGEVVEVLRALVPVDG